jgi:hypothetical protein
MTVIPILPTLTPGSILKAVFVCVVVLLVFCFRRYCREAFESLDRTFRSIAERRWLAIAVVAALPIVFRLALLPLLPIPEANVMDEQTHLVIADTLASGRLANPTHPFWVHFEAAHVLQRPTYSGSYPPGQGAVLAVAQRLTGVPWFGVLISVGVMCGAICWTLQELVEPKWALIGGLVSVINFAMVSGIRNPELSYWINSYWGGAVAATGGTLLFGSLLRLIRSARAQYAVLVAVGWSIVFFTRTYEAAVLGVALTTVLVAWLWRTDRLSRGAKAWHVMFPMVCVLAISGCAFFYYNYKVTGDPLVHPLQLHRKLYGIPQGFYWQPPVPEPPLLHQSLRDVYQWELQNFETWHRSLPGTVGVIPSLWEFFFGVSFTIPLFALPWATVPRRAWLLIGFALFGLVGSALYPFYFPHYSAQYTAIFVLVIILGMRALANWRWKDRRVGEYLLITSLAVSVAPTAAFIGYLLIDGGIKPKQFNRPSVEAQLQKKGGRHLVFVHNGPKHNFHREWVYNAANIDGAPIVWAREWTTASNEALMQYFSDRFVWSLDPDPDGQVRPVLELLRRPISEQHATTSDK